MTIWLVKPWPNGEPGNDAANMCLIILLPIVCDFQYRYHILCFSCYCRSSLSSNFISLCTGWGQPGCSPQDQRELHWWAACVMWPACVSCDLHVCHVSCMCAMWAAFVSCDFQLVRSELVAAKCLHVTYVLVCKHGNLLWKDIPSVSWHTENVCRHVPMCVKLCEHRV